MAALLELIFILPHSLANPFLHRNKPSRESFFLRQGERLVDKKGTHNVKFIAEKWTNGGFAV